MNIIRFFAALLAVAGLQPGMAFAKTTNSWKVGEERETRAGLYMKLIVELNGWRIWREEGASSINCAAVKPAKNVAQPQPLSSKWYYGGYPALVITETSVMDKKRIDWQLLGTYSQPSTQEIRLPGERFYVQRPDLFADRTDWEKIVSYDGKIIEVHVGSWEYPAISVGYSDNTGLIDLTGMSKALEALVACNANKI